METCSDLRWTVLSEVVSYFLRRCPLTTRGDNLYLSSWLPCVWPTCLPFFSGLLCRQTVFCPWQADLRSRCCHVQGLLIHKFTHEYANLLVLVQRVCSLALVMFPLPLSRTHKYSLAHSCEHSVSVSVSVSVSLSLSLSLSLCALFASYIKFTPYQSPHSSTVAQTSP